MRLESTIDNALENDNRNYDYDSSRFYFRSEFPVICDWLSSNTRVIDLGCANGSLMKYVLDRKKVEMIGIEKIASGVDYCLANNLSAIVGDIDKRETYEKYQDSEFDYAICNVTLQMVMFPEVLLGEMRRISQRQIISFPNFAFFGNRLDLLINGCMPRPMLHGYRWYDTGHIHQLSLRDFYNYCRPLKWSIEKTHHLGCWQILANLSFPNFFSKETIFLLRK